MLPASSLWAASEQQGSWGLQPPQSWQLLLAVLQVLLLPLLPHVLQLLHLLLLLVQA